MEIALKTALTVLITLSAILLTKWIWDFGKERDGIQIVAGIGEEFPVVEKITVTKINGIEVMPFALKPGKYFLGIDGVHEATKN